MSTPVHDNQIYKYNTITRRVMADLYTPVATYMKIRDRYSRSFLMESSDFKSEENGRSFIGFCPLAEVAIGHGKATYTYPDGRGESEKVSDVNPVENVLSRFISSFDVEGEGREHCGLYGFTTFNAVRYFENIEVKDTTAKEHDAPDILYSLYKYLIVFDHFNDTVSIIALTHEGEDATRDIDNIDQLLNNNHISQYSFHPVGNFTSTLTDDEHRANIRKCIAHCMRGDVFQIVISRRFVQRFEGDDFKLYRALRSINPSPYLFYFDFGGYRIFGSSPETHFSVKNDYAFIDPIAGTTRRTGNDAEDLHNANMLRNDPKENAEHTMLVDLARNDLSRNCHDVHVESYKELQYYSHVIHLVSRVGGTLDVDANPLKAFIDTFPAGTLSGAPKVRAMQLISEYEPHNRGAYGGCIGFIGFNGTQVHAIVIRTFISRGGELWFQAGGGIVAKSNVESELQEVNNKLGALRKAITVAETL